MKIRNRSTIVPALLIVAHAAISTISRAAEPRYHVIDLGSLGGHHFYANPSGINGRMINSGGTVVGGMSTTDPDPFCWNDGTTSHAFEWKDGSLTDLGPAGPDDKINYSQAHWINDLGHSVGIATFNADASSVCIEPLLKAVLWKDRQMIDLGTLGGNQSYAHAINNRDQTVGWALDTVDGSEQVWSFYPFPFGTRQRAALWENGSVRDLGTLGGPSAWALGINEAGQIIGQSHTTNDTGAGNISWNGGDWPWTRPVAGFIWQNGTMTDLGNLGGTWVQPLRINQRGQVIGWATMPGDSTFHPFLWDQGVITDLGTLGGNRGSATDMNDAGEVVGGAALSGGGFHAFLWKDGVMEDLGSVRRNSQAWHINSKSQIVGTTGDGSENSNRAFLWENGGPMVDLNTLIPTESPMTLRYPLGINDAGEILAFGVLPNGDSRPCLLIPMDRQTAPAGQIVAWGYNQHGQTNVPPGDNFVAIDAGQGYHGLALRSDGSLAGWGWNYGDAVLGTAETFYGQAIVPAGNNFKAIAAAAFHSLALRSDGSLAGWGSNENFDGTLSGQATVPAGNNFTAIAAGDFHGLALKSDGSLVAWGDNSEGQTNVPAGNDFVAIAAGDFHNLARKSDGSLVAWGMNNVGQVSNVPPGNDFTAIAAGWGNNLALKSDGSLVGWGWNFNGQSTPPAGNNFVAGAAGWRHCLALKSDGSLAGWGYNENGQTNVPPGSDYAAISAGWRYSLAIQMPAPVLSVTLIGDNALLSWSADYRGYTLEASADLSPLTWATVPGDPTIVGNRFRVTDSAEHRRKFYRLKK